jgi:DNA-binding LytR/AlgR family response regulator
MKLHRTLADCRILIVEDEYLLAEELRLELEDIGAEVVGPVGTVDEAAGVVRGDAGLDGAVLDVNLHGEMIFGVADMLAARAVPFVFATGYDASVIPGRFDATARCEKPIDVRRLREAIGRAVTT